MADFPGKPRLPPASVQKAAFIHLNEIAIQSLVHTRKWRARVYFKCIQLTLLSKWTPDGVGGGWWPYGRNRKLTPWDSEEGAVRLLVISEVCTRRRVGTKEIRWTSGSSGAI